MLDDEQRALVSSLREHDDGPAVKNEYQFEDIRTFFTRRSWLVGKIYYGGDTKEWRENPFKCSISDEDYSLLKARKLVFSKERSAYLRAYIDGWLDAK